ncbi:polysaccharide deacetylase family protein [Natrarchaeobius chitinivorans]|uniref:Polysaccharide deacetylase n=1 Tax=Natrarchaeobius chitinivorans TaxID=1679083 RepID=A0A3N6MLV4_NATCH|nr:hypothetical protein [Natrarchaeobius chitinivorans]RQG95376.1 hypothetical protein EA473_07875 [Natrarchaeobius chitinivorans]
MTNRNRRSFVRAASTVGTIGLAGCLGVQWDRTDEEPSTEPEEESSEPEEKTNYRADLPGESLETFEELDGWVSMLDGGRLEADRKDPYAGSQSAHLIADEDDEYAGVYGTLPHGENLRDRNLSLAVKFTGRKQLHLTLELFAPNSRNAVRMRRVLVGPADRWVRVDFGTTRIEGRPDLGDVREFRLRARRRGEDEGPIECWIDDLRAVERPDRGKVVLLFDGTLESHHITALEYLDSYGFSGVEAVIPEAVGETGRLTLDQLDELVDSGWDVAARPRTGVQSLPEFSPEEQEGMIGRTAAWLEHRGFEEGANHFLTPRNVLGTTTADLVAEYHEQAFRFGGGPNALPVTDPHNLGFVSGAAGEETNGYVDRAAEYGQLTVLHFEHLGDDGLSEDSFADLLEHVATRDVDVVTASELLEGV